MIDAELQQARAAKWHLDSKPVRTLDDAREFIESIGFCLMYPLRPAVLLPTFMGSLDQTILATALPTIGRDFGDVHNLPWLITAYLLASTAVIPLYGKIADVHGRRFTLRTNQKLPPEVPTIQNPGGEF